MKKYLEYLGNPDDETYFKPKTDDWVVWMKKDSLEVHITLLSFDESGTIVQYTDRRTNTDGSKVITKTQDGQYKSADEMVFYWDYFSSANFMGNVNKYKHVPDKFYIFNDYGDKLYASLGLSEEDTRKPNPEDPDYQDVCAVGELFGSDYYIELGDIESHDAFIPDGVFGYDAFSYRHGELYCYDEKGKCVKFCEIILLDDESHIDAYNMCFYGAVHDKAWTYIKLDEENYNKYVEAKNIKYMGRIIYMDFNDKSISSNEKKVTRLINNDGYFSKPYLTESQIETIYKK